MIVLIFAIVHQAKSQEIDTDGTSETEAPHTITAMKFQAESDIAVERENGEFTDYFPESLLRFGLFKNLELRADIALAGTDTTSAGFDPIRLGAKYHLFGGKNWLPEISAMAMVKIPWLADGRFHERYYEPELRLLLKNELTDKLDLGYNLGMLWNSENRQPEYVYTISGDAEVSKKVKFYAEEYCFAPVNRHAIHTADLGILYLLTPNLQLDLAGGTALTHTSDFFLRGGIAFRI